MNASGVITEIVGHNKNARLTNLQFQNGELLENQETALSCGLYHNDMQRLTPVLASDSLIYTGQVMEQNAYNTFIGVRNKKTNKIKLIAINECMLKPQPPKLREIMDSTLMETNKRALTDLHKEFGSKKTKRQTETLERLKVNVDNYKDQLEKTVANISLDDLAIDEPEQTSDILPYINKNASVTSEVYTFEKLIPTQVVSSLKPAVQQLMNAGEEENIVNEHIKKQIMDLQTSGDENAQDKVAILIVLDALMTIYSANAKNIKKNYQPSRISRVLGDFILQNFTIKTEKTITRPISMRDKASCYIIVLNLLLNDYRVDLIEIATQLKMGTKKLQELCSMLLLHINEKHAVLKLPLPAPRVFTGKPRKGRK